MNLYLEADESKAEQTRAMMIGTPGQVPWTTLPGSGAIRGMYPLANGFLLAVQGSGVYRVTGAGTPQLLGSLLTNAGPVSIEENGQVAVMADGQRRYVVDYDAGTVSTLGQDPSDRVAFIDGYFIFNRSQTQFFDITDLYSTTIVGTAAASGSPDRLVTLIADHRELWLFGQTATEVWTNTGNADFPFERLPQAYIQTGCIAPHSVARMDNTVFWLGADERGAGIVWRADGYRAARVSTHAIEHEIQAYATTADAFAYAYQQDGHTFYVLTFPSADRTWCYDAATGEWHERAWFDALNQQRAHRASCAANYLNRVLVGDTQSGAISEYSLSAYTEAGTPIRRIRTAQHEKDPSLRRLAHRMLQVDMERGVGVPFGQGSQPQAMLRWSDDGGNTWSSEAWATFGAVGEYQARARWRRLGSAFDRVYELTISDPVKVAIVGAVAEID